MPIKPKQASEAKPLSGDRLAARMRELDGGFDLIPAIPIRAPKSVQINERAKKLDIFHPEDVEKYNQNNLCRPYEDNLSDDFLLKFQLASKTKQKLILDLLDDPADERVLVLREAWRRLPQTSSTMTATGEDTTPPDRKPPRVKDDPAFQARAAANQWTTRRDRGLPWRMDVFAFIRDTYGPWLGKGLMRSDLSDVDKPLWDALHKRLKSDPLPIWLHLPTEAEAKLASIKSEASRRLLEDARALWRKADHLKRQVS